VLEIWKSDLPFGLNLMTLYILSLAVHYKYLSLLLNIIYYFSCNDQFLRV